MNLKKDDYFYMFANWCLQIDIGQFLGDSVDHEYDIYVSMKCEGKEYGGDESKPGAAYIDRLYLVSKG